MPLFPFTHKTDENADNKYCAITDSVLLVRDVKAINSPRRVDQATSTKAIPDPMNVS